MIDPSAFCGFNRADERESTKTTGLDLDGADLLDTASVSSSGEVTLPDRVCERLGLDPSGRITFHETDAGAIVIERVPSAEEMTGFAARTGEATTDIPATELLREMRESEKSDLE